MAADGFLIRKSKELALAIASHPAWVVSIQAREEGDPNCWVVQMRGPEGSPYADGIYTLWLDLHAYPAKPPELILQTPIVHPQISGKQICSPWTKSPACFWLPKYTVLDWPKHFHQMLAEPDFINFSDEELSKVYLSDPSEYQRRVAESVQRTTKQ